MNNNTTTNEKVRGYVRPILTMMFSFAFVVGTVLGAIDSKYLVYATLGILVFWFGERAFAKFGSFVASHNHTSIAPAAPSGVVSPPSPPPAAPSPAPVLEAPPEPLDIKAFHSQVLADVVSGNTKSNPATVFYTARDKGAVTPCDHINHAQDYWDYLVSLVYAAESYVKEMTETQTAEAGGCQGVTSPEYALMVQNLQTTVRNRDHVYALARSSIDWRKALGLQATLFHVGVWAEHMLKAAWEAT